MDATSDMTVGDLQLGEAGRDLWEALLPQLSKALAGDQTALLTELESTARAAGLGQRTPVRELLDAFSAGSEQVRGRMLRAGTPRAEAAARRLIALERVALTRIASGYMSGLEETISRLRRAADQSSPFDADTGAYKPEPLSERLSLEVERCQRMDLPLGLLELAVDDQAADRSGGYAVPRRDALHGIGDRLRENLRRYDSIGLTLDGAFLLVLPDISRRGLAGAAERLRRDLASCAGHGWTPDFYFALAHYDFVDVNAKEMLAGLRRGMQEARSSNQSLAWS